MKKTLFALFAVLVFSALCLSSCTDNMIKPNTTKTPVATLPGTKTPVTTIVKPTPTPDTSPITPDTMPSPNTVITPDTDLIPDTIITPDTDTIIPDAKHFSDRLFR
ncbi:MAG: hypothetical protein E7675_08005 [Ruminococcaceae bacterium]|nr:hypothetical protein [Oscillospiraceae bacterium]